MLKFDSIKREKWDAWIKIQKHTKEVGSVLLEVWQKENNNNCCHNFVCVWESSTTNDEHEKIARIFMSCDMRNFSLISFPRNIIKRAKKKNHGRKPTSNRHDKMCGREKIIINCLMHSSLAQHHPLISNHHHHHHRVKISSGLFKTQWRRKRETLFSLWWQESFSKQTSYLKWIPTHTKTFLSLSFFAVKII